MRFLRLLDPSILAERGPAYIRLQSEQARERFPHLVRKSRLHLWNIGDMPKPDGIRLLIGLAPGYSLVDMRLADLMNDALAREENSQVHVDVLDAANDRVPDLRVLFPKLKEQPSRSPVAGVWRNGIHVSDEWGFAAVARIVSILGLPVRPGKIAASVNPPSEEMFEER